MTMTFNDAERVSNEPYAPTGDNLNYSDHVQTYHRFVAGFWLAIAHIAVIVLLLAYFTT